MKLLLSAVMTAMSLLIVQPAFAEGADPLMTIQSKWAECQYESKDNDHQVFCLENLIKRTEKALKEEPNRQELKVWLAINKSSLAGADGGLGALALVKEAKVLLEQVIDKAPETLNGSAYTSLGSLYYQVPGWPIGFGDDDMAEKMLRKALEINPDGIDPNYFYGDFLAQDGRKKEAKVYLTKAQKALPRAERPLADHGRQLEIKKLLGELK